MASDSNRFEGELVGFSYQADDGAFAVARVRAAGTPRSSRWGHSGT